jgi:hypothetical protein
MGGCFIHYRGSPADRDHERDTPALAGELEVGDPRVSGTQVALKVYMKVFKHSRRSAFNRSVVLAALVTSGSVSACSTRDLPQSESFAISGAQGGFDVNDISWLLPKNENGFPYPDLKAESLIPIEFVRAIYQPFLDEDVKDLTESSPSPMTNEEKLQRATQHKALFEASRWRVVGVRYDPCAPTANRAALQRLVDAKIVPVCLQQLRLILQPFNPSAGQGEPADLDVAAHAVYTLGVGPVDASSPAVAKLLRLKEIAQQGRVSLAGTPLDIHPALAKEMKGPRESAKYTEEFTKLIQELPIARLTQVALFSVMAGGRAVQQAGDGRWKFKGGQVGRRGADGACVLNVNRPTQTGDLCLIEIPVPILEPKASVVTVGCNRAFCFIDPQLAHQDNIAPLLSTLGTPAVVETLHKIDNPEVHHFFSQDCASCHMTTSLMVRRRWGDGPSRIAPPQGISGYLAGSQWKAKHPWDFRNFGYFQGRPTASARTALEAGFAADDLNRQLKLANPGPDCRGNDSAGAALEPKVWQCFRDGKDDCLSTCKARQ